MRDTPHGGFYYQDFLSSLSKARETECYLEVGVQSGFNFSKIHASRAIGVDPEFNLKLDVTTGKGETALFRMTSDRFFKTCAQAAIPGGLDLAFLDGMHLFEYLLRDFYNAEKFASPSSVIALHDCLPFDGEMIERDYNPAARTPGEFSGLWTGDVWKVIPILKKYRPELQVQLFDCHPTGLVCITGLDRTSTVLQDNYFAIVKEFQAAPNDLAAIEAFYADNEVLHADDVVRNFDHSLYFRV